MWQRRSVLARAYAGRARLKMLNKENRYRTFTGHCTEGNMSENELLICMKANNGITVSFAHQPLRGPHHDRGRVRVHSSADL